MTWRIKANLFNEYFFSVFLKDSNLKFTCPPNSNTQSLHDIEISTTEVFEILSTLDVNKAPGIDGISPAVLKYCASPLLVPLCHLFTCSISSGRIPVQWCTHCIIPIHKSGDKTHIKNYRPISLLCIVSKVLERIVYNRIMNFAMNSFTQHQFGFLPGRSTLQQLIKTSGSGSRPRKVELASAHKKRDDYRKYFTHNNEACKNPYKTTLPH